MKSPSERKHSMKYLKITRKQKNEGYLVMHGNPLLELAIVEHYEHQIIRETEDGAFIVRDPHDVHEKEKGLGRLILTPDL